MTLESVLAWLYAHEIECGLESVWDGGWIVWIGPAHSPIDTAYFADLASAVPTLMTMARQYYPALKAIQP